MVTKFQVYRAACIFGLADGGLKPLQIKGMEGSIAEWFADQVPVEVAVRQALLAQVEAG